MSYLTASCCKGVSRESLCNRGSSLPWDGGVGRCCLQCRLSTAHNALCRRGWNGRHSLFSSNRGMLGGGNVGSRVVGLLVRHRCSSLHREYKPGSLFAGKSQQSNGFEVNSADLLYKYSSGETTKLVLSLTNPLEHLYWKTTADYMQAPSHKLCYIQNVFALPSWVKVMLLI